MIDEETKDLDQIDLAILDLLQENGRMSNADLARHTNLSPPAIHARLRRLETDGFIRQYAAILDREALGYDLLCFISVIIQVHQPNSVGSIKEAMQALPEVLECHHVTGEYDYLLKVAIRNRKELEHFVMEKLTPIPGIAKIHTSLVLKEIKSTTAIPISARP
ncbi:MAG: Lrp/AsnC family transcriptional regulator [Anaerolineae bacterium]|nr:Lrp/AsnC family transcriptional regulator [Anaerolineae bacterium]